MVFVFLFLTYFAWRLLRGSLFCLKAFERSWSLTWRLERGSRMLGNGRRKNSILYRDQRKPIMFFKLWMVGWGVSGYVLEGREIALSPLSRSRANNLGPWLSTLYGYLKGGLVLSSPTGPFKTITNLRGQVGQRQESSHACMLKSYHEEPYLQTDLLFENVMTLNVKRMQAHIWCWKIFWIYWSFLFFFFFEIGR